MFIGEELGADRDIEYYVESQSPSFLAMEEKYMQILESSYQVEKNAKQFKKIKIKASIRTIQRAWRRYYQHSKVTKAILIQNSYRNYVKQKESKEELAELIKDKFFAKRLQNRLRHLVKVRRSRKTLDSDTQRNLVETHKEHLEKLKKIQGFVRIVIAKVKARKLRLLKSLKCSDFKLKINLHRMLYKSTKGIDSELVRRIGHSKLEIAAMDKYLNAEQVNFDKNWNEYEKKLEHYLKNEKEFEDWHEIKDETGTTYWINNKTLKKSKNHPGIKSFKINKQKLRQEAEEEQQIQIGVIENRRKRFVQMISALLAQRTSDLKDVRREALAKISK